MLQIVLFKKITCFVEVDAGYEHEISRLHILLPLDLQRQGIKHVSLVPGSDAEAKVLPKIEQDSSDQTAAIEEKTGFMLLTWKPIAMQSHISGE